MQINWADLGAQHLHSRRDSEHYCSQEWMSECPPLIDIESVGEIDQREP